jgi:hypothetical protein
MGCEEGRKIMAQQEEKGDKGKRKNMYREEQKTSI